MFSKSSILYRYYHGENDDQIGQVGMFLNGTGRYTVLWETMTKEKSDRIAPGFGPISGLSRGSIEEVIRAPTLSGKKRIDGRQLLSKAKNALKESKILLAFWGEFVKMGMPSGKTEVGLSKRNPQKETMRKRMMMMKIRWILVCLDLFWKVDTFLGKRT
jgi:hypothetical protein